MRPPGPPIHGPDMCAGFQVGGAIMTSWAQGRHAVVTGPEATSVVDPDDLAGIVLTADGETGLAPVVVADPGADRRVQEQGVAGPSFQ